MRKFVNPAKYLSKKNMVIFVLLNLIYTVAFFTTFIPDSLWIRAISAVVLLIATVGSFIFVTYIQALITRKEFECTTKNYQSYYDNDEEEEDVNYDYDTDEDYDDEMDEDFDEDDIEEMNKESSND